MGVSFPRECPHKQEVYDNGTYCIVEISLAVYFVCKEGGIIHS